MTMRKMVRLLAALLIVFSVADAHSAGDSTLCKVINSRLEKHFTVLYKSQDKMNVEIKILDEKDKIIYSDVLSNVNEIKRDFDLTGLKDGVYSFILKNDKHLYRHDVDAKSWNGENLRFADLHRKVALVGKNDSGSDLDITIYDDQGNLLHEEEIEKDAILSRLYNLEKVYGRDVTILIFEGHRLIQERTVKL